MAFASDRATSTCSWAIWAYVASDVNWLLICDSTCCTRYCSS